MKRIATTLLVAGLFATPMLALPPVAQARVSIGIGVSVGIAPPPLPVYAQPVIPGPGYIWTPGYWAWNPDYGDYYWVPGTWVMPPQVGLLWTPGWWGWSGGFYRWHGGYWGSHVGFYGGVNYGFGYFGSGYAGGYWRGPHFYYNRAVNNINMTRVHNVYEDRTVVRNVDVRRVSYNGGRGGIAAQPTAEQRGWMNGHHYQPTTIQARQRETAMRDPGQRFSANHGRPAVAATREPGHFDGPHAARGAGGTLAGRAAAPHGDGFVHAPPRSGSMRAQQAGSPSAGSMRPERQSPRDRSGAGTPWNSRGPDAAARQDARQAPRNEQRPAAAWQDPRHGGPDAAARQDIRQAPRNRQGPAAWEEPRHGGRNPQAERPAKGEANHEARENKRDRDHSH